MKKENIIAVVPSYEMSCDEYLSKWTKLLNNKSLIKILKKTNTRIYFYSKSNLKFKSEMISVKRKIHLEDINLLVTDNLSLELDYISMLKPVIYYRFNKTKEFNRKLSFGKVLGEEEDVINKIIGYINLNYRIENYYQRKINAYLATL